MNFNEYICASKLFAIVMGFTNENVLLTKEEFETACEALKHFADENGNWNQEQKEIYKSLVEYAKQNIEKSK